MAQRALFVQFGEGQHVFDQPAGPVSFLLHPPHGIVQIRAGVQAARAVQLGVPANGGDWGSQFVRRVGDEPPQTGLGRDLRRRRRLEPLEHRVERGRKGCGFSPRMRRVGDTNVQRAASDPGCHLGHLFDGPQTEPVDPERHCAENCEDEDQADHFPADQRVDSSVDIGCRQRMDVPTSAIQGGNRSVVDRSVGGTDRKDLTGVEAL